jgi:hypothetical protein
MSQTTSSYDTNRRSPVIEYVFEGDFASQPMAGSSLFHLCLPYTQNPNVLSLILVIFTSRSLCQDDCYINITPNAYLDVLTLHCYF